MDIAVLYDADVIVFEHLNVRGKKKGSKKQRLHHWRSQEVQRIVTDKAHRLGIRISRINPYGTSRYAYDGSGQVLRGKKLLYRLTSCANSRPEKLTTVICPLRITSECDTSLEKS